MIDLSAFDLPVADLSGFGEPVPASAELPLPPSEAEGFRFDRDGLVVPILWHCNVQRWEQQPIGWRKRYSDDFVTEMRRLAALPEPANRPPAKTVATRFTTDYAVDYGRDLGWRLVDREHYNFLTKRHHDLMLGVDVIFDPKDGSGLVGIQGAGKSERKRHYDRFIERGGVEKARERNMRVIYLEFERGSKTPILKEDWA